MKAYKARLSMVSPWETATIHSTTEAPVLTKPREIELTVFASDHPFHVIPKDPSHRSSKKDQHNK